MSDSIESRLADKNITLPEAAAPAANYLPYTISGNQLFISGQLPMIDGAFTAKGQLGHSVTVEQGVAAAETCAINILAQAKAALGDLSRIKQVVKISGFVSSTPDFYEQHLVINGASNLLAEILADAGKHARAAVGMSSLPFNASVEIDAIIEFE
ncbi:MULTISPECIES: RidA family protein [unclassified Lentilitoribacter]|jgi:enamine deaminase RidA (YjgF/YER057c/UK114 family)|uniref:RidA family protein n=1 Tax=unclassified Lentilitoribacter TaxID=2647570 RepID=UPI0013A6F4DD|nr:RidA family protein [Lentilitoribacter sp. Alg239-R112]